MGAIIPFLMLDAPCDEAAKFYASVFKDSKVHSATPMQASFSLNGTEFNAFRGGPHFTFGEGLSLFIDCKDQAEVDHYWDRLVAGGGKHSKCGWLQDKYGCWWQVVPRQLGEMLGNAKDGNSQAALQAMLKMAKLDIKTLEKAYRSK